MTMKKLGFGLMRLPQSDPADNKAIDIERTKAMADRFMAEGFTYFDTAAPYHGGMSEVAFGEAVAARYPRDSYILTDKPSTTQPYLFSPKVNQYQYVRNVRKLLSVRKWDDEGQAS